MAILFLSATTATAQFVSIGSSTVVKVDSATHQPDKTTPIPFDQPFTIVLTPSNPQTVLDVMVFGVFRDSKGKPTFDPNNPQIKLVSYRPSGPQLILDFPAIKPNTSFDIYLKRKLDTPQTGQLLNFAAIAAFDQLFPILQSDSNTRRSQDVAYQVFYRSLGKVNAQYGGFANYEHRVLAHYIYNYLFHDHCIHDDPGHPGACLVRSIDRSFNGMNIVPRFAALFMLSSNVPAYVPVGASFAEDLKRVSIQINKAKYNDQTITGLIRICNAAQQRNFYNGLLSIDYQYQAQPLSILDVSGKLKTIRSNLQRLIGLQDTIERLVNEMDPADAAVPALASISTYLQAQVIPELARVKTIAEQNVSAIMDFFTSWTALYYPEWYVNNTDGFKDMQTASSSFFSPQVGISCLGLNDNSGGIQVVPKITLGVNINFRPVNKSLIRRDIPKKIRDWRNYLSGFVGITFGGFNDPQYSNLLTSNSLLLGLNCRVTRAFYFSMGASLYRHQFKNPDVNGFHTQVGAYASFLLDLDITNAVSNFVSLLTK